MKTKYILLVSGFIILCLGWMAFANAETAQKGTEKYAMLVVEYDVTDFSYDTKELMFSTVIEGQTQKETIKVKTGEHYNEINKKMNSLAENGFVIINSDELIVNPGYTTGKIRTKRTFTFKKTE